jgi:uncharacterized lipoprotein
MMPSKRSSWSLSLLLLTAVTLAVGCATARRDNYIQEKASNYVYHKPLAEIWPEVRAVLGEHDVPIRETPGSFEISSDWQPVGAPSALGTNYVRYLVRGKQPTPATSTVEILRQNRTEAGKGPTDSSNGSVGSIGTDATNVTRDREMEWELLQRVDPEGAKALRDEAQKAIQ